VWRLQLDVEVEPQLAAEAVQRAERAARQQHAARGLGQAPVCRGRGHGRRGTRSGRAAAGWQRRAGDAAREPCSKRPAPRRASAPLTHPPPPPPPPRDTAPHLNTTAGLRHHRHSRKAQLVAAAPAPASSAKASAWAAEAARSLPRSPRPRRPLCGQHGGRSADRGSLGGVWVCLCHPRCSTPPGPATATHLPPPPPPPLSRGSHICTARR
jgi:hypothetical protein